MYHNSWDISQDSKWETAWEPLGGSFTSPPAAVSWSAYRLDVFGVGSDGAMYHNSWDISQDSQWQTPWQSLSGSFTSPPAAVSWSAYRLDVFGVGSDSAMYHNSWDVCQDSQWQDFWQPLGYPGPVGVTFKSAPAAVSWNAPHRLDLFGVGSDGAVYHNRWDVSQGAQWQPAWDGLPALPEGIMFIPIEAAQHNEATGPIELSKV
jgi:hypothetical protein